MTDRDLESAFELAFRGLVWANLDDAPGEVVDDPTTLKVGDVVATRGHGRFRAAVVTSVGRKNAKAVFTTPGAIDEAERIRIASTERWANLDRELAAAQRQAERNFDYYVGELDPATRQHRFHNETALDNYRETVAGGLEAFVEEARERCRAERAAAKARAERPLPERVLFTAATVKPGQAKKIDAL